MRKNINKSHFKEQLSKYSGKMTAKRLANNGLNHDMQETAYVVDAKQGYYRSILIWLNGKHMTVNKNNTNTTKW